MRGCGCASDFAAAPSVFEDERKWREEGRVQLMGEGIGVVGVWDVGRKE